MSLKRVIKEIRRGVMKAAEIKETSMLVMDTLHQCAGGQMTVQVRGLPGEYPLIGGSNSIMPVLRRMGFASGITLRGEAFLDYLRKTGFPFSDDEEKRRKQEEEELRGGGTLVYHFTPKAIEFYKRIEERGYYRIMEERRKRLSKIISDSQEEEYGPLDYLKDLSSNKI